MRRTNKINPPKHRGLFATGVTLIALAGIVPAARGGHLGNGSQQRIQAAANQCLAMPHDQMMKDQGCKSMMALHPELFPGDTVKPQNAPSH